MLRVTGLCAGNSSVTGEFPAQMASNAESFFQCHTFPPAWSLTLRKTLDKPYNVRMDVSGIVSPLFVMSVTELWWEENPDYWTLQSTLVSFLFFRRDFITDVSDLCLPHRSSFKYSCTSSCIGYGYGYGNGIFLFFIFITMAMKSSPNMVKWTTF